mmetsp:Transcript_62701/g.183396  ORF Transcript_62701/g.183396 Transcript_62701/m.183396 type:complete len:317 (+) Transcript_62701:94-1044(+)
MRPRESSYSSTAWLKAPLPPPCSGTPPNSENAHSTMSRALPSNESNSASACEAKARSNSTSRYPKWASAASICAKSLLLKTDFLRWQSSWSAPLQLPFHGSNNASARRASSANSGPLSKLAFARAVATMARSRGANSSTLLSTALTVVRNKLVAASRATRSGGPFPGVNAVSAASTFELSRDDTDAITRAAMSAAPARSSILQTWALELLDHVPPSASIERSASCKTGIQKSGSRCPSTQAKRRAPTSPVAESTCKGASTHALKTALPSLPRPARTPGMNASERTTSSSSGTLSEVAPRGRLASSTLANESGAGLR